MNKKCVLTILLLSSVAIMAQTAGQQAVYPKGSSPRNQQPAKEVTQATQAFVPDARDRLLEGCVAGTRENLTLTDAAGKVYQLRGETAKLAEHIGQQASVTGTEAPHSGSGSPDTQ